MVFASTQQEIFLMLMPHSDMVSVSICPTLSAVVIIKMSAIQANIYEFPIR